MRLITSFSRIERPLVAAAVALVTGCGSSSATTDAGAPMEAGTGDGSAVTTEAGGTDTGTGDNGVGDASDAASGAFVPSNVPLTTFPTTAGDVTIATSSCTADTDNFTVDCVSPGPDGGLPFVFVKAMQSDGSEVSVLAVNSLYVATAGSLSLKGSRPLIVWARTTVSIHGSFTADPTFHPTNGGGAVATPSGPGGGPGGGAAGLSNPQVGGGGGSYCGVGGSGANSSSVTSDAGSPAAGGRTYGNAPIVPLVGGSAGGAPMTVGGGGEGGGAIEITAGTSIDVGSGGMISVPGYGGSGNGGAGGSGGALLLEAPNVSIEGVLAANGGGGAVFSGGGNAQDGQPSATPAMGQDAHSAVGSAGTQINGADGTTTPMWTSSGGGGAGRIRINTRTGAATFGGNAVVSPSLSTACATQGTLM
jgi:hypothetical protein